MTTSKAGTVRAGLYCRISDDRGGGGLGVERQRKDCAQLAAKLGWQVVDTYTDNDISAYSGKRRPEYERMLADLATGRIDAVVTWHLDRLNRSPVELERLIPRLEQRGVQVQTVTAGVIDIGTPSGRAVARTLGAWARFESEHKSERIRAKKRETALLGGVNAGGSNRPYGYAADKLTVIPAEAKLLRALMRRFLAGTSTAELCRDLNARGVPATGARAWFSGSLDLVLCSARIAGWRQAPRTTSGRGPGEFLVRAQWPAIVSRRDVERARALMADETRRPGSPSRWLLAGIVLCDGCGQPMAVTNRNQAEQRYGCARGGSGNISLRCGHVSIAVMFLDRLVTARLTQAVEGGLVRRMLELDGDLYAPTAESVRADEVRLAALGHDHDTGVISRPEWLRRRNAIAERVVAHRQALTEAPDPPQLRRMARAPKRFGQTWAAATLREQRTLVRTLTRDIRITAAPADRRTLNPDRVHFAWRA
jgi:site-specific DNA recombinase